MKRACLALALLLVARQAAAAPVALTVDACPNGPSSSEVYAALGLELVGEDVTLVPGPAATASVTLTATWLQCPSLVVIALDRPSGPRKTQRLDLNDLAPDLRTRALALSIAELYRALVLERVAPAPDETAGRERRFEEGPSPSEITDDGLREHGLATDTTSTLGLSLELVAWPTSPLVLLGPRVDLGVPLAATPLALHVALGADFGASTTELGDVASWSLNGTVGLNLVGRSDVFRWSLGPRFTASALSLSGSSSERDVVGTSGIAPLLALGLGADAHLFVTRAVYLSLGVEGAMTLLGARAMSPAGALVSATDARLGVFLGIGWTP